MIAKGGGGKLPNNEVTLTVSILQLHLQHGHRWCDSDGKQTSDEDRRSKPLNANCDKVHYDGRDRDPLNNLCRE